MRFILIPLFVFFSFNLVSQSLQTLSRAEKIWTIQHPIAALKIKMKLDYLKSVVEGIKFHPDLDTFSNGGKLDAFRHIYSMAYLSRKIKKRKLLKLGEAHEKGNYEFFISGKTEFGELPDSSSRIMDLHNNLIGIEIGFIQDETILKNKVFEAIKSGKAKMILKNKEGNYLDCDSQAIIQNMNLKKWNNRKCVIPTN